MFVRTKHIICRDKSMFVATNISTKMILVKAPANDNFELEHSACGLNREEQLGSHSELDSRLLQVSTVGFFYTVFVTVSPTTVERASCKAHKLLLCLRCPHHLNCLLWQSDISCFYGSERLGRATGQPSPPRPLPLAPPPAQPSLLSLICIKWSLRMLRPTKRKSTHSALRSLLVTKTLMQA